jgi:hypothetical protein
LGKSVEILNTKKEMGQTAFFSQRTRGDGILKFPIGVLHYITLADGAKCSEDMPVTDS